MRQLSFDSKQLLGVIETWRLSDGSMDILPLYIFAIIHISMESVHWTTYILQLLPLFAIAQIANITIFCNHFYFKPDDDH